MTYQEWWHTSVISALRRLRQKDHDFEANLGYIDTVSNNNKKLCQ
jgi:hypothetical protein